MNSIEKQTIQVLCDCPFCGAINYVTTQDKCWKIYCQGESLQDAFPMLNIREREYIRTGICDNCFSQEQS